MRGHWIATGIAALLCVAPAPAIPDGSAAPAVEMLVRPDQRVRDIGPLRKGLFHWKVQDVPAAFWKQYEEDVGLSDAFVRVSFHPNWGTTPEHLVPVLRRIREGGGEPMVSIWGLPKSLSSSADDALSASDQAWKRWAVAMPKDGQAFRSFVKGVIEHWNVKEKLGIRHVEIGNEPDLPEFWLGTEAEYLALYRMYAEAIREVDPAIRIGGPAVNHWVGGIRRDGARPPSDPGSSLIRSLIRFCAKEKVPLDFVSWHFFTPGPYERQAKPAETTRRWLAEAGLDPATPLVVDEWAGVLSSVERPNALADSEAEAAYGAALFVRMADAGIDRQSKTCLLDAVNPDDAHPLPDLEGLAYGIVTRHGVIKPVYNLFRMLARMGSEQVVLERSDGGDTGPLHAAGSRDGERVTVLLAHWAGAWSGKWELGARWQCLLDAGFSTEALTALATEIHRRGADRAWEPFWRGEREVDALGLAEGDAKRVAAAREVFRRRAGAAGQPVRVRLTVSPLPFEGPIRLEESIVDSRRSNSYAARELVRAELEAIRGEWREEVVAAVKARGLDAARARTLLEAMLARPSAVNSLAADLPRPLYEFLLEETRRARERLWTRVAERINRTDGVRLHTETRDLPCDGASATLEVTMDPDSVRLLILTPGDR